MDYTLEFLSADISGEIARPPATEAHRAPLRFRHPVTKLGLKPPRAESAAGRFRSDLFYRLSVVELHVMPLRDRREDIPFLTAAFVRQFATQFKKPVLGPTPAAERLLFTAEWPGNVRELRNVIERVCILCEGRFFSEKDMLASLGPVTAPAGQSSVASDDRVEKTTDTHRLADAEREHITRVLKETAGNKKAAAQLLGLSRRALYRKLDRLGLR